MSPSAPNEITLLTPTQVARAYGVSLETVRRWLRKGILPHVQVGPYHTKRIDPAVAKRYFTSVSGAAL